MNDLIRKKLMILPDQPGCYLMKDKNGTVIYVGKAKILKNRVRSYFTGSHDGKTLRLVSEIVDFEYIVTSSNLEALLLELNLIKKYDPKYNIMLKDDKTYPYIKITNEAHPRLLITRKIDKRTGTYFGPYPNAKAANETKKLLDRVYPLRKCDALPKRECLYYHMHQCLAPCILNITEEDYAPIIEDIRRFLSGNYDGVKHELERKMMDAAEKLEFERAKEYRDQILAIEAIMEKQKIILSDFINRDVFGYSVDKGWMCVQVFFIRQGKMLERDISLFPIYDEPTEEFLSYVMQFYERSQNIKPKEIFVPLEIDQSILQEALQIKVVQPKRDKKKALVDLASKNASIALKEKFFLIARNEERTIGAMEQLGEAMDIPTPTRIEAFDNANIQGTDPVSAMVVFIDGKPAKKEYRKYKIRTVVGPDDYETMREVVRRRYTRMLKESGPMPDLIIIDGGKGQIHAAKDVLENELGLDIPVAGLVKDERHRTSQLLFGEHDEPVSLSHTSQPFYLLQRIQDEVHRFAISFHRQTRSKNAFQSILDDVEGIGEKRKKALLKHFGSVKKIKEATVEMLQEAGLPEKQAQLLYEKIRADEKDE